MYKYIWKKAFQTADFIYDWDSNKIGVYNHRHLLYARLPKKSWQSPEITYITGNLLYARLPKKHDNLRRLRTSPANYWPHDFQSPYITSS